MKALRYVPIYFLCIGLPAFLWHRPMLLTACYAALSALLLWRFHTREDLIYFFVPCLMGPAGELAPVALGAWSYSAPQFLIPAWLPLGWGIAALFMRRTSEAFLRPERAG